MSPESVPFDAPALERGFGFFETLLLVGRRAVLGVAAPEAMQRDTVAREEATA